MKQIAQTRFIYKSPTLCRFIETPVLKKIVRAFAPPPLPPEPPLDLLALLEKLSLAEPGLGRLDGLGTLLPRAVLVWYGGSGCERGRVLIDRQKIKNLSEETDPIPTRAK